MSGENVNDMCAHQSVEEQAVLLRTSVSSQASNDRTGWEAIARWADFLRKSSDAVKKSLKDLELQKEEDLKRLRQTLERLEQEAGTVRAREEKEIREMKRIRDLALSTIDTALEREVYKLELPSLQTLSETSLLPNTKQKWDDIQQSVERLVSRLNKLRSKAKRNPDDHMEFAWRMTVAIVAFGVILSVFELLLGIACRDSEAIAVGLAGVPLSLLGGVVYGFFLFLLSPIIYPVIHWLRKILWIQPQIKEVAEQLRSVRADCHQLLEQMVTRRQEHLMEQQEFLGKQREHLRKQEENLRKEYAEKRRQYAVGMYERIRKFYEELARDIREWKGGVEALPEGRTFTDTRWQDWVPAVQLPRWLRIGEIRYHQTIEEIRWYQDMEPVPAIVPLQVGKGILIETPPEGRHQALLGIHAFLARLLAAAPPGALRFVIIDPVALGDSIPWLLNLRDPDESEGDSLISGRAWVETGHIQKQLLAIREHIATLIQERLRDKYDTIEEYNKAEGEIAEPYRIVAVLDFPANFSSESAELLLSIAQAGPRCGVYPIIMVDTSRKLPHGFDLSELENASWVIRKTEEGWEWQGWERFPSVRGFCFEEPPDATLLTNLIEEWGSQAKERMKVKVPFAKILDRAGIGSECWWQSSTRESVQVPLGLGERKGVQSSGVQYLELGDNKVHALVVGKTGSGKSNLLHVLITASALLYPPSELRLCLIDLKTVELVIYRDLPHAEVVAVDADREYALSVLEALYDELIQRMEQFKQVAANDLAEYREKQPDAEMPRILLIVDEFQVLFEYDDRTAAECARILDRVVRQGRAFGIHVLLGSQSLAGRTLPKATMDQMGVRIALQCSDADSRLILAEDNPAARHLRRPGEAIYNSANGLIEGNSRFQVAYFSDSDRNHYLQEIQTLAEQRKERGEVVPRPVVFEGNEPARLERYLQAQAKIAKPPSARPRVAEALVGEPIALKPPVAVRFARRSSSHLVVVTREEEEGVGMILSATVSLCAQYPPNTAALFIADFTTSDAAWAELPETFADNFPHDIQVIGRRELLNLLNEIHTALRAALEQNEPLQQDIYLVLLGLHRIRDLRQQEDAFTSFSEDAQPSPTKILADLLRDGPEMGIHLLIWCDTVANLRRSLDRRMVGELGFRVAGAMSEQDSSDFIDDPAAGRLDKPYRVILYDDEHPGVLTKFRPFIIRDAKWLESIGARLKASL